MRLRLVPVLLVAPLALGGCLARTALDIVTLPVRVASSAVDAVTTSQSERDATEGRRLRREDERRGREAREQTRRERREAAQNRNRGDEPGDAPQR
jgi:hypothetical protein